MLFMSLTLSLMLCLLLMWLYSTVSYKTSSKIISKASGFECGFEGYMKMRRPFSVRYFVLVILFLIFDVETVLLFPCLSVMTEGLKMSLVVNILLLLVILMVGLLYEWKNNMLDWTN
uniref:NADH-ubiquinone oxidoreductase chain 3 n=1 Tax=Dolicheulota formosensis TaxID=1632114 RepID=A0A0H3W554_DOLFO|nr:NADH dehydrogenase subunit 3 [Dolicheulota formosensis]AKJ85731.1 NADH dehydrogenase subunit 3 [Dolicheulota formosensis]